MKEGENPDNGMQSDRLAHHFSLYLACIWHVS
jgi:hypothetical protein